MNQSTLYCIIIFTLLWIAAMLEVSGQENGIFKPQWNFIKTKSNIDIACIAYLPLWIAIICFNGNVSTMYTEGQSNCVPTRTCPWPLGSEGEVVWDIPSVRLQLFVHGLYQTLWLYYLSWKNIPIDE